MRHDQHDAPVQAGGSCDYCGTAIVYTVRVQAADGKRFKIAICGQPDA